MNRTGELPDHLQAVGHQQRVQREEGEPLLLLVAKVGLGDAGFEVERE